MAHLIITPGDPTGIGPEITVKALQRLGEFPADLKLTIIGKVNLPAHERVTYIEIEADKPGEVAYQAIDAAVKMIASGKADALVTGPISKQKLIDAGYAEHGHTEILQKLANEYFSPEYKGGVIPGRATGANPESHLLVGEKPNGIPDQLSFAASGEKKAVRNDSPRFKAEMLFVHKKFRLLLLTRHIALAEVPKALAQPGAVAGPIKTLIKFLRERAKVIDPKVAVLGVNPHCGEVGGEEEQKIFKPIINAVNGIGNSYLAGPFAADGFFRSLNPQSSPYDAIIAAYHDQGLIPFKMLAGYEAVNMTIGLPFIRTSVSHGTAEDIVGKDAALEHSLIAALHAALEVL